MVIMDLSRDDRYPQVLQGGLQSAAVPLLCQLLLHHKRIIDGCLIQTNLVELLESVDDSTDGGGVALFLLEGLAATGAFIEVPSRDRGVLHHRLRS